MRGRSLCVKVKCTLFNARSIGFKIFVRKIDRSRANRTCLYKALLDVSDATKCISHRWRSLASLSRVQRRINGTQWDRSNPPAVAGPSTRCRCEREHVFWMRRLARIIVRSENRRSDNRHSGAARVSCEPYKRTRRNDIVAACGPDFYGQRNGEPGRHGK